MVRFNGGRSPGRPFQPTVRDRNAFRRRRRRFVLCLVVRAGGCVRFFTTVRSCSSFRFFPCFFLGALFRYAARDTVASNEAPTSRRVKRAPVTKSFLAEFTFVQDPFRSPGRGELTKQRWRPPPSTEIAPAPERPSDGLD